MADSKVADLTEDTAPAGTDLVYVVHDPAGTPADRKVKVRNLRGAGSILALVSYAAGSDGLTFSSSSSYADIDATNLTLPAFTAPPSGAVLVQVNIPRVLCSAGQSGMLRLADTGGTAVSGTEGFLTYDSNQFERVLWEVHVTGLTPGTSYTWRPQYKCTSGNTNIYTGPTYGKIIAKVLAA